MKRNEAKVLKHLVGWSYKAKELDSEDFLVEVNTTNQSEALLNQTTIVKVKVSSPRRTFNFIRGLPSKDEILHTSEQEFLERTRSSGFVAVKRIMFRQNGEHISSKYVILTFEKHALRGRQGKIPELPHPLLCPEPPAVFSLPTFGHVACSWRGKTCAKCGSHCHVSDILWGGGGPLR